MGCFFYLIHTELSSQRKNRQRNGKVHNFPKRTLAELVLNLVFESFLKIFNGNDTGGNPILSAGYWDRMVH